MEAVEVMWRRLGGDGFIERATLDRSRGRHRLRGQILASEDSAPLTVTYRIDCDFGWRTRRVEVVQRWKGEVSRLDLTRNRLGWHRNGDAVAELEGCTDVDLSLTPSTNCLPVNRLGLAVGQHASTQVAWIIFPDLEVASSLQTYERLTEDRYRFRVPDIAFEALIRVGEHGLPIDYAGFWERIASWPAGAAARPC